MFFIKICLNLIFAISLSRAFDPFVGRLNQGEPCFETIEFKDCSTTIPQVFSPSFKGTNTNAANTTFWLFTSENTEKAEPLHKCGGKLPKNSAFDPELDTIIVVSGIIETLCTTAWQREFKEQFFLRGDYNVILVDWSWGNPADPAGVINSFVTGEQMGFLIKNIMLQNDYTDGSKFYIIAHSAGVYSAITAGRFIREWKPSHKIRRITLLEPPIFNLKDGDLNFNTSYEDADFVDIMHTGAGTCFPMSLGLIYPGGHADFYVNGGTFQLSCYPEIVTSFLKGDFIYAALSLMSPPLCSHVQVLQYFKVSITSPAGLQIGAKCDSYEDFVSGACKRCCKNDFSNCAVAGFDAEEFFPHLGEPRQVRKYYYELGLTCPYNEDYNFSVFKDCKEEGKIHLNAMKNFPISYKALKARQKRL